MSTFVFFHVGPDLSQPVGLVRSVRAHHPDATIIQTTDEFTDEVPGVDRVERCKGAVDGRLMYARVEANAALALDHPAAYLDTDLRLERPLDIETLLRGVDIGVIKRFYHCEMPFNGRQHGGLFRDCDGRPLGELYPIVGCLVLTPNYRAWDILEDRYLQLPPRFSYWYGDQEVLRDYVRELPAERVRLLCESEYACLPEFVDPYRPPALVHFKGARKRIAPSNL